MISTCGLRVQMFSRDALQRITSFFLVPTILTLTILLLCIIIRAVSGLPDGGVTIVPIPYLIVFTFCIALLAELACRGRRII